MSEETIRHLDIKIDESTDPAIGRIILDGIAGGSIDPTIMSRTLDDDPVLEVGSSQDAGLTDTEQADEYGVAYVRRYSTAGSVGIDPRTVRFSGTYRGPDRRHRALSRDE
jgi:hypothetical protein